MNKVFFLAVTNHIAANVSQIKWVDADEIGRASCRERV